MIVNAYFLMTVSRLKDLTMLPVIETEQANRRWPSSLATPGDSSSLVNCLI
jgi:hypothetical protein